MTLKDLQLRIIKYGVDACLVTRNNMFINQDILDEENLLMRLVGFTGSEGRLLVFHDRAYLFVDGRYGIQASHEVDNSQVEVIVGTKKQLNKWLEENIDRKTKIAVNHWNLTVNEIETLEELGQELENKITFIDDDRIIPNTLSDKKSLVFEHAIEFAGLSKEDKIEQFIQQIKLSGGDAYFTSAADSVSWLLNIRSNCLPETPIVRAMALVDISGQVTIFGDNLDYQLSFENNIKIMPFSAIEKELAKYKKKNLLFCFYQTPAKIRDWAKKYKVYYSSYIDPGQVLKVKKNNVELSNMKTSHLRDGIVVSKFLCWLEKHAEELSELDVSEKLFEFRRIQENFFSNSFETIVGSGSNGALPHYTPTKESNKKLETNSLVVIDSGAQYLDGTTDVTRTIPVGTPTEDMVTDFTIVLKAHIALSSTVFPKGTSGMSLDIIARRELWKYGTDYSHGTGHGVGFFLNVHEGPINISSRGTKYPLKENMVTSIEPGYYKEGEYGIRTENLVYTKAVDDNCLAFEPLTLIPINKMLINPAMLNSDEKNWLNDYHKKVYSKLEAYMDGEEKNWLENACSPI